MEDGESRVSGIAKHPLLVFLNLLILVGAYGWRIAVMLGLGRPPRRARRRRDRLIYRAFDRCMRLFIAPAPPPQPQRSQQSTIGEELQPNQSTIGEELQYQQSTEEDKLHSATEEELQSAVEDVQPQRLAAEEEIQLATKEEVHSQQSETGGCPEVPILHEGFQVNIWNTDSLKQCLRNLIASFREKHPIQFAAAHSPNGSNCSSPRQFEYTYRDAWVNENNDDQFQPFGSLFSLDHGGVRLIDGSSLLQHEDMIHKLSGKPGCEQIMYNAFEYSSHVVYRLLRDCFTSVDISIDAMTCMVDHDSAQIRVELAKRFVMNIKVMARLLCLMKDELDNVECASFDKNLRDWYFNLCARRPIQNLIDVADSVSKLKWSASDIYQMLVLYEAIDDALRAFSNPNESITIVRQMQVNFEEIFDRSKGYIDGNLNDSCERIHDRHQLTNFLIHSMKLFGNHNNIVLRICDGDATSSLGDLLLKVITYWADGLKKHSDSYAEGSKQIFLLNNLTHFTWEVKRPLQLLEPNSDCDKIIEFLESLISKYTLEYLEKCWGPVRNCVELRSGRKVSSLNKFMSKFEAILSCQGTWELETSLKNKLRAEIRNYIAPCYAFLRELRKNQFWHPKLYFKKYITAAELEDHVTNFFESRQE